MPKAMQVALIRGINVGRAKRVAMADLRAMLESFGYTRGRPLLNSGNAVYSSAKDAPATAARRIEKALAQRLDVEARVVALTAAQIEKVVAENPLLDVAHDPSRYLVAIPLEPGGLARLRPLVQVRWGQNAFALGSRVAYLWCATGILESTLLKAVSRALDDAVTTRNWATMLKLRELLADKS